MLIQRLGPFSTALTGAMACLLGCADNSGSPATPADHTPPAVVRDLTAVLGADSSAVLAWTAVGDDSAAGRAESYQIRRAETALTDSSWGAAVMVDGISAPRESGQSERFVVQLDRPRHSTYFALKVQDEAGNSSPLSNNALLDLDPPSVVGDLAVRGTTSQIVFLSWTSPTDNGLSGRAASYEIRRAFEPITFETWSTAVPIAGAPTPLAAGQAQSFRAGGLQRSTLYYFTLRSADAAGNLSALSDVVSARTSDVSPGWWDGFATWGPDQPVEALHEFGGDLIVGGVFTQSGPSGTSRIASWNGVSWSSMGDGFSAGLGTTQVIQLAEFQDELIAVGLFGDSGGTALNNIARWDGRSWQPLGGGTDGHVIAAASFAGSLYVGGVFATVNGQEVNHLARWDGETWHSLQWASSSVSTVTSLLIYGGELVVGGAFSQAAGVPAHNVALYDGSSWSPMGDGLTGGSPVTVVAVLAEYQGELIAGGNFTRSGATFLQGVARWDGNSWQPLGVGAPATVYSLAVYHGDLIAAGRFTVAGGGPANNIARWDGTRWRPLDSGVSGTDFPMVHALAVYQAGLYVGGSFQNVGSAFSPFIARWNE